MNIVTPPEMIKFPIFLINKDLKFKSFLISASGIIDTEPKNMAMDMTLINLLS